MGTFWSTAKKNAYVCIVSFLIHKSFRNAIPVMLILCIIRACHSSGPLLDSEGVCGVKQLPIRCASTKNQKPGKWQNKQSPAIRSVRNAIIEN